MTYVRTDTSWYRMSVAGSALNAEGPADQRDDPPHGKAVVTEVAPTLEP
jgi:hypothetical protein